MKEWKGVCTKNKRMKGSVYEKWKNERECVRKIKEIKVNQDKHALTIWELDVQLLLLFYVSKKRIKYKSSSAARIPKFYKKYIIYVRAAKSLAPQYSASNAGLGDEFVNVLLTQTSDKNKSS